MRYVLEKAGLHIPTFVGMDNVQRPIRHANEFWDHYGVATHTPQPGDILFFSQNGHNPTHLGFVRDEETYIHAPGIDKTRVELAKISFSTIAHSDNSQILYTVNPIGFKAPTVACNAPTYRNHQKLI